AETKAAEMILRKGCALFEAGQPCGEEANMAKLMLSEASWKAGEACLQSHGGFGFATEYNVERKWRETRVYQVAPISTNLILAYLGQHVLGMPRSY
ncbi:acyl-CoA dehydrogenase family protein, partial [Falsigemmobacter intermedius]|uniref:acyl-CoA dehydrogenase family protein n=1 Tax=Falsigemmobacter intermedius TaxID=1553448 RepID=UPI003F050305